MPNTFDSIPQSITQRAMANNFSLEEQSRREAMQMNKDFYYAQSEKYLELMNEDQDPYIINMTKPVVNKRATLLYKRPLVREYTGPAASIAFIEAVYKENKIDMFLLSVDLAAELTGSGLVLPQQVSTDLKYPSGIKLRLYDGVDVSVVPTEDDPTVPDAISIVRALDRLTKTSTPKNPQVERIIRQQIWTEEGIVTYDGHLLIRSETNNLGFLPFVNFRGEEVYNQYLGHAPTNIIRLLNEDVNQLLTHLGYLVKMQAGTPIVLEGYASGEGVVIHPGRAFSVPSGANASVLQTNPKLAEMLKIVQYLEEKVFETSSVPKVSVVGGEGESGRELLVRWFPLLQLFQEKCVRFEGYELDLANMILRVVGMPILEELIVKWPVEEVLPLNTDEDTLEMDVQLHIKTPIDELMRRNPHLTEDEAEAEILANRDFNMSLTASSEEDGEEGDDDGETPSDDNKDKPESKQKSGPFEKDKDKTKRKGKEKAN